MDSSCFNPLSMNLLEDPIFVKLSYQGEEIVFQIEHGSRFAEPKICMAWVAEGMKRIQAKLDKRDLVSKQGSS